MAKKLPALPLRVEDHFTTLSALSPPELGAWTKLWMLSWHDSKLTREMAVRAVGPELYESLAALVEESPGGIAFRWVEEARERQQHISAIRAASGRAGGRGNKRRRGRPARAAHGPAPAPPPKPPQQRISDQPPTVILLEPPGPPDAAPSPSGAPPANGAPPKKKGPDERITRLLALLAELNKGMLDGNVRMNRNHCSTLLRRMESRFPEQDPEACVAQLIKVGKLDPFHGPNITSFKYLVDHGVKIINQRLKHASDQAGTKGEHQVNSALEYIKSRR